MWIALKCLSNTNIKDYWIVCNPTGVNKFDDIVLYLDYSDGRKILIFLQLKHSKAVDNSSKKTKQKKLHPCMLETGTKYNLEVYQEDFMEIVNRGKDTFLEKFKINNNVELVFGIYTNLQKYEDDGECDLFFEAERKDEVLDIVATVPGATYRVEHKKNKFNENFLKHFVIYLNQTDEENIRQQICSHFGLDEDMVWKMILDFVRQFEPSNQDEKFSRRDMIKEMLDRFFGLYKPPETCFNNPKKSTDLLNVMRNYKITIIKHKLSEIEVWREILSEISKLDESFNEKKWTDESADSIRKFYLEMVTNDCLPFFMETSNHRFGTFKKFFSENICSNIIVLNTTNEIFESSRRVLKDVRNLKIIDTIDPNKLLNRIKISFQNKTSIKGSDYLINTKHDNQILDIDVLIKYLDCTIKLNESEEIPNYYINREIQIPIIKLLKKSGNTRDEKSGGNCIQIYCNCSEKLGSSLELINLNYYLNVGTETEHPKLYMRLPFQSNFVKLTSGIRVKRRNHIHFFEILDNEEECVPVYKTRTGKCTAIEVENISREDKLLARFCNQDKVHIISNNAGEGKRKKIPMKTIMTYLIKFFIHVLKRTNSSG